jgi:hypothetical protein
MDISLKKRIKRIEEMVDKVLTRKGDPLAEEENLKSTLRKKTESALWCCSGLSTCYRNQPLNSWQTTVT